jgi:uncharacterized protein involved in exopolysaccharide biosynthesis/Mrp family chromosome partitioning ATPase
VANQIIEQNGSNRLQQTGEYGGPISAARHRPGHAYAGMGDLMRIVQRRRMLMLITAAIVLVLTFAIVARMTPLYTATSVVMVEPLDGQAGALATAVANPNEEARIATKVELLSSRSLARRIVRSLQLGSNKEFAPAEQSGPGLVERVLAWVGPSRAYDPGSADFQRDSREAAERARTESITSRLLDHVRIERVAKSHLINVSATSASPAMAALIANRFAETHIKSQLTAQRDSDDQSLEKLRRRLLDVREQVAASDSAEAEFRRDHGLLAQKPEELAQAEILRLDAALGDARSERAASGVRVSDKASPETVTSPLLNELRGQEATLGKRLSELTAFYGPGYPEITNTTAQLDAIRTRINTETARVGAELTADAGVASARTSARTAQLASDAAALRSRGFQDRLAGVRLRELARDADTNHALYLSLLTHYKDLKGRSQEQEADMSIVSRASLPEAPSNPQPKRALAAALIGSIVIALILALIAETLDNRLRTAEQVRRLLGLDTLAMVPELPPSLRNRPALEVLREHPQSFFTEALRNLVIEVDTRRDKPGSQVVVVTSALPDEGKTTIATSLAAAAATIGRSAVIVDLDLRRHHRGENSAEQRADVVAFITENASLEEVLSLAGQPPLLGAIPVRQVVFDPGSLLESPRLRALLAELRQRFDLIVLNTPPILPVRDAKTLSGLADATLLVLRWGVTSPAAARTAIEALGDGILGAVLNRVDYRKHAKRRYGDAIELSARSGAQYYRPAELVHGTRGLLGRWRSAD